VVVATHGSKLFRNSSLVLGYIEEFEIGIRSWFVSAMPCVLNRVSVGASSGIDIGRKITEHPESCERPYSIGNRQPKIRLGTVERVLGQLGQLPVCTGGPDISMPRASLVAGGTHIYQAHGIEGRMLLSRGPLCCQRRRKIETMELDGGGAFAN
jgi:hypothetical protein